MTLVGVMGALAFVLIELSFTTLIDEDVKTGRIGINWGLKNGIGYSSFAMFWVNVCFNPIMLFGYRYFMSTFIGLDENTFSIVRVLFFPFNIWLHEIITGYSIMFVFGRNVAWEYVGVDDFCHGNCRWFFYPFWLLLGVAVELVWKYVEVLAVARIGVEMNATTRLLRIALPLTLLFSPRMKLRAIYESVFGVSHEAEVLAEVVAEVKEKTPTRKTPSRKAKTKSKKS